MYILECSSYATANIITIIKNIINLVWVIGPILCIISLLILFTQLIMNPDEKKLPKKIKNSVMALILLFMVPTIINASMYLLDDSIDIASCWNEASKKNTLQETSTYKEPITDKQKNKITIEDKSFEKGEERKDDKDTSSETTYNGNSETLKKIFNGARKAANHTKTNNYHYGNATSWDGKNMKDPSGRNTVSCDRGVGLSLYFAGLTKTEPYKLHLVALNNELQNNGWKRINNFNELKPGDVVFYDRNHNNLLDATDHAFLIGENITLRYDWGSDARISYTGQFKNGMPFTEGISNTDFGWAYRAPGV